MAKVLVLYYSRTGNTEKMAKLVAEGVEAAGAECKLLKVKDAQVQDMLDADCIMAGSPTYYGGMAWELKKLFDDSVEHHGSMEGKVGGAFSSAANVGGGNETTILDILHAMIIHGMIVKGLPLGDHYGPVAVGSPDERAQKQCRYYGKAIAGLAMKLFDQ